MEAKHSAHYNIRTTWNNQSIPHDQHVSVHLSYHKDLKITVRAPFYDDPKLPDMTDHPGTFDKLYNYEVVEVFLLGDDEKYLEIELGPKGQYLLLQLQGYRNVTQNYVELQSYHSHISGKHWHGTAVVANDKLPPNISHFNAYAIHGSDDERIYLSLFPAPENSSNYTQPDFHRLELFEPISIFR